MKIAIIGLGYVGAVTGSALADMGHHVTLVDRDEHKVSMLNAAQSPIAEPGLKDLIINGVSGGYQTQRLILCVVTTNLVRPCQTGSISTMPGIRCGHGRRATNRSYGRDEFDRGNGLTSTPV